jgi:hypothetical protein
MNWKDYTPEQVYEAIRKAPRVAGEWEERRSERQRVENIFVRSTLPLWDVYEGSTPRTKRDAAMVWGPLADGNWIYSVPFKCGTCTSEAEAKAKADECLAKLGWMLCAAT